MTTILIDNTKYNELFRTTVLMFTSITLKHNSHKLTKKSLLLLTMKILTLIVKANSHKLTNLNKMQTEIHLRVLEVKMHRPKFHVGFEPNSSFFVFWVQTQRSLFRSSGFEPRGLKNLILGSDPEVTI